MGCGALRVKSVSGAEFLAARSVGAHRLVVEPEVHSISRSRSASVIRSMGRHTSHQRTVGCGSLLFWGFGRSSNSSSGSSNHQDDCAGLSAYSNTSTPARRGRTPDWNPAGSPELLDDFKGRAVI